MINFEKIFLGILNVAFAWIVCMALYSWTVDKKIDCYYTKSSGMGYAVVADIEWFLDPIVFRTTDIREFSAYISSVNMCGFKDSQSNVTTAQHYG